MAFNSQFVLWGNPSEFPRGHDVGQTTWISMGFYVMFYDP